MAYTAVAATRRLAAGIWTAAAVVLATAITAQAAVQRGAGADPPPSSPAPSSDEPGAGSGRCVVRLHGKSGSGGEPVQEGDETHLFPTGNAEGWGGRQWLYFPDDRYDEALAIVADAVSDCDHILLHGFSNGASFVAKLYCRGETFDGRLLGVVIDDPVPDEAVVDCDPDTRIRVALYWTGDLEATAQPGWDCSDADWTCEGGVTIGIEAYAEWLDTEIVDSPHETHQQYWDPPELSDWSPLAPPNGSDPTESTATPGTPA